MQGGSDNSSSSGAPVSASGLFKTPDGKTIEIRDVWASNLEAEMENIREIIQKYPYVAMDTEFPGVVAHPVAEYGATDTQYQTLKCNVDLLKLIQLGLSFTDAEGNFVDGCTCWQFNFKFSLSDDLYAQDSIELLKTSGIDFERFERYGIDINAFGEQLMMSGLVLNEDVKWVTFSASFDFGYLLKTLTGGELPLEEGAFMELFRTYFPYAYDCKFMMTAIEGLYGGLASLAESLEVQRIGPMHQAGSDSLLTSQAYFKLMQQKLFTPPVYDDSKYCGEVYGMGSNHTKFKKYGSTTNVSQLSTSTSSNNIPLSSSSNNVSNYDNYSNNYNTKDTPNRNTSNQSQSQNYRSNNNSNNMGIANNTSNNGIGIGYNIATYHSFDDVSHME